jgi:hypothetical protein
MTGGVEGSRKKLGNIGYKQDEYNYLFEYTGCKLHQLNEERQKYICLRPIVHSYQFAELTAVYPSFFILLGMKVHAIYRNKCYIIADDRCKIHTLTAFKIPDHYYLYRDVFSADSNFYNSFYRKCNSSL